MSKREENLKKINSQLELMSDEELENVAGGTIGQTAGDSKILYDYGLMKKNYGIIPVLFYWLSKSAEVDAGWAKAGITCVTAPLAGNKYFLNGKEISRSEAYAHLKANFKRIHHVSDD